MRKNFMRWFNKDYEIAVFKITVYNNEKHLKITDLEIITKHPFQSKVI